MAMEKAYNSNIVPIVRVEKRIFTKLLIIPYLVLFVSFSTGKDTIYSPGQKKPNLNNSAKMALANYKMEGKLNLWQK